MTHASIVVLTRNEAADVPACIASLREATVPPGATLEILVVDAASTDDTLDAARRAASDDPRVRILALGEALTVGAARNVGVREAVGDVVGFVSADASVAPDFLVVALDALRVADAVYARQEHTPARATVAAVSRGLRYHLFDRPEPLDAGAYASNVGAVYRRALLERFPFPEDGPGSAVDDVLLARRASAEGHALAYAPSMVVRHRDVETLRGEARKLLREGRGWGSFRRELGLRGSLLAWGALALGGLAAWAIVPTPATAGFALGALWAPALRRALARKTRYPALPLAGALALAPLLDLLHLGSYLRGVAEPARTATGAARRPWSVRP